jgi:P27 family predicted phage terminase small subunit
MGRTRKPTAQKRREGTDRPGRSNPAEPVYAAEEPPIPGWLTEAAKAEWERLMPLLRQQGVLAVTDLGICASYCMALSDLEAATLELSTAKRYYQSGSLTKEHPAVKAARVAQDQIKQLAAELGLTPSSRSKVVPPNPPPSDPMAPPSPPVRRRPPVN